MPEPEHKQPVNAQPPSPDMPGRSAGSTEPGPYTQAIRDGKCPLCLGTGAVQELTLCLHHGQMHHPGEPCGMCGGTGRWPPPEPPPLAPVPQSGWSR